MPLVAYRTWTASVVTVAQLNEQIRDNGNVLRTSMDANGHLIDGVIQSQTSNYTILATDDLILCTTGSFTVTLPTAIGCAGKWFKVKNTGTGTITMGSTSSQTIDGATASATFLAQNDCLVFESDNANWIIT